MNIPDRNAAEIEVCTAIATLGRLAGIDVDLGEGPDDIDANLIQAAYESNFSDPAFLGGPGCFDQLDEPGVLATLDARTGQVTRGLARYIARRGGAEAMQQVQSQLARIDAAFAWLRQQHHGACA